jgi:hypothetical protein
MSVCLSPGQNLSLKIVLPKMLVLCQEKYKSISYIKLMLCHKNYLNVVLRPALAARLHPMA